MCTAYHLVADLQETLIALTVTCYLSEKEGEKARHSSNRLCHGHPDPGPGMLGVRVSFPVLNPLCKNEQLCAHKFQLYYLIHLDHC